MQALHDSEEFDSHMNDFCDFVAHNYKEYFNSLYLNQPADLTTLRKYIHLLCVADAGKADYARDVLRFYIEAETNKA